jgi:hypothetical protein
VWYDFSTTFCMDLTISGLTCNPWVIPRGWGRIFWVFPLRLLHFWSGSIGRTSEKWTKLITVVQILQSKSVRVNLNWNEIWICWHSNVNLVTTQVQFCHEFSGLDISTETTDVIPILAPAWRPQTADTCPDFLEPFSIIIHWSCQAALHFSDWNDFWVSK